MVAGIDQYWETAIEVGKFRIPSFRWYSDIGTYGQLGRFVFNTSVMAADELGFNINYFNSVANAARVPCLLSVNGVTLFGGYYTHAHISLHSSEVEFWVRDYACVLFDSKTSLASLDYQNKTVSQLVRQICIAKGLNPNIQISKEADVRVGNIFTANGINNGGNNFATYPRPLWNILVLLARASNCQMYTVPSATLSNDPTPALINATPGTLIFKQLPENPTTKQFDWMPTPSISIDDTRPAWMTCDITHQPQRNNSFSVVVKSHHQQSTITTVQTATVLGQDVAVSNTSTIKAGYFTGSAGAQIRSMLSSGSFGIPVYEFPIDGLTPDQAQAKAESIAQELASKLLVFGASCDFDSSLFPNQRIQVNNPNKQPDLGVLGRPLYITGLRHSLNMPQDDAIGFDGVKTSLKLLNIPPVTNPMDSEELGNLIGA